jgi:demethylmenaquinone methyltransferase/2-methoxy-6-polyprenyl-1,4-benzoquinol methylase
MSDRSAAARIFRGIAPQYSWVGAVMSLGQDGRWRRAMVARLPASTDALVLDVAAGTGLVSRALVRQGRAGRVVALDPSEAMLSAGVRENAGAATDRPIHAVLGRAEELPFGDASFDAVTFTYLLRYVDDPAATLAELARVLRPGGVLASLEFHMPEPAALRLGWRWYTRGVVPAIGAAVSPSWRETGAFLGPSIERFVERAPLPAQARWWHDAGLRRVRSRVMSLGAGVVWSGEKPA